LGWRVLKLSAIESCVLTIGSPPVLDKSYDKNSLPRNVASAGALSETNQMATL
jgi:hypothetical protein